MSCNSYLSCHVMIQGAAIDRILGEIIHSNEVKSTIDYVLCVGHFLPKVHTSFHAHKYAEYT